MLTFRKTFFWLISFPEILVETISWVLFCNFAVSPLIQNKSALNREQEWESRSYSLSNTELSCTKGGGYSKLQNRAHEITIHPDHKKIEFSQKGRVSIELLPKIIWEQEVNSKKSEKSHSYKNWST